MFGGLLAFLGIYAGSAAKAAYDNYDMKKILKVISMNGILKRKIKMNTVKW